MLSGAGAGQSIAQHLTARRHGFEVSAPFQTHGNGKAEMEKGGREKKDETGGKTG